VYADGIRNRAGGSVRLATALRELWTYRAIIVAFAERNIRVKYKRAALVSPGR
jgi:hypothetical protein